MPASDSPSRCDTTASPDQIPHPTNHLLSQQRKGDSMPENRKACDLSNDPQLPEFVKKLRRSFASGANRGLVDHEMDMATRISQRVFQSHAASLRRWQQTPSQGVHSCRESCLAARRDPHRSVPAGRNGILPQSIALRSPARTGFLYSRRSYTRSLELRTVSLHHCVKLVFGYSLGISSEEGYALNNPRTKHCRLRSNSATELSFFWPIKHSGG